MAIKGERIPELNTLKNLFFTTVRIQTEDETGGDDGVGTGFFYHIRDLDDHDQTYFTELLITNKHVIKNAKRGKLVFHLGPAAEGFPTGGTHELVIDDFESKFILHPDTDIDLCAINISPYLETIKKSTGKSVFYQALSFEQVPTDDELKNLFPIADVYMVGYPIGLWDQINNLPIARRGVTASHPYFDFNEKSMGVVDIACFPGSSGSPIITFQRDDGILRYYKDRGEKFTASVGRDAFALLGILFSGEVTDIEGRLIVRDIPVKKERIPTTNIMVHLGYYIKAKELLVFESLF
ncbi:MAG: serine protease [Bacteroidota bacterium]